MARLRRFVRLIPGGAAIASLAATVKRHSDNATVTGGSVTTGPNGDFDFKTDGCPDGALYWEATSGGTTKRESGQNHGQLGAIWTDDLPYVFELFGTGVYAGYLNTMAVSAPGGMNVAVATGMAVVKGIRYGTSASTTKAVTAADPTNPRIDRVIVRVKRPTATNDAAFTTGQSVLVVLAGTPAPSPVAPALTQDANTWELSLAQVAVAAGASSISTGNITDERTYIRDVDTITVQEGDATVDSAVTTLDFDASDFNVTSSPAGEANVALAYGTVAGTPAEGDHAHTARIPITLDFQYADISGTTTVEGRLPFWETSSSVGFSSVSGANLVRMDKAGKVVGMALMADDNRTAGTLTAKLKINGVSTAFDAGACQINGTNTLNDSAFLTPASGVAFAAGQTVGVEFDASTLSPTLDALIQVFILLDSF